MYTKSLTALLLGLLVLPFNAYSATREEAQALTEKAVSYIETNGVDTARTAMQDKAGEFVDGELYVFVINLEGITLIHGANPKLVGKDLSSMKDPKGNYFVREMGELAKTKGSGWVSYMWTHPETRKLTPKVSFVKKIGSMDAYAGVGIYE